MMKSPGKKGSQKARLSAARLAAVQAVYQGLSNGGSLRALVPEYIEYRLGMPVDEQEMVTPDKALFSRIVTGIDERLPDIEHLVRGSLADQGKKHELLLQSILYCGAYELLAHEETDAPVLISDYMHIADAFFEQGEKKLVNGVLDKIARNLRT